MALDLRGICIHAIIRFGNIVPQTTKFFTILLISKVGTRQGPITQTKVTIALGAPLGVQVTIVREVVVDAPTAIVLIVIRKEKPFGG